MKVNPNTGDVTMAWRDRRVIVLHNANYTCQICHEAPATEADHIWPRSMGGRDEIDNLQATCLPCNRAKGSKAYTKDITSRTVGWSFDHFAELAQSRLDSSTRWGYAWQLVLMGTDPVVAWETAAALEGDALDAARAQNLTDLLSPSLLRRAVAIEDERDRMSEEFFQRREAEFANAAEDSMDKARLDAAIDLALDIFGECSEDVSS